MEILESEQSEEYKAPELPLALVEDCFKISAGTLSKNILQPQDNQWCFPEDSVGKFGKRMLRKRGDKMELHFEVVLSDGMIVIQYWPDGKNYRMQEIIPEAVVTPYGERIYLTCRCGHRGTLYLRSDFPYFVCRKCGNLSYEIKSFDKRSIIGKLGHALNRHFRFLEKKAAVKRITYMNKLTKKATAILKFARRCGLMSPNL